MYTRALRRAFASLGLVVLAAAQAALPPAADLAADGAIARPRGATVVVLFTIENCRYCETVKRRYLEPLAQDPRWRERVLVREVNASHGTPLRDFDGAATDHARYAAFQSVQLYPTVRFFGPDGSRRAPDIVGQVIDDFYWAYLREAVDAERNR
jgi:thioredoxin-related protein